MVEIRIVVLCRPFQRLRVRQRGANRKCGPYPVLIVAFVGESRIRISLARVASEFRASQRTRQSLLVMDIIQINPESRPSIELISETRIDALARVVCMVTIAVGASVRQTGIKIERFPDSSDAEIVFREVIRAAFTPKLKQP